MLGRSSGIVFVRSCSGKFQLFLCRQTRTSCSQRGSPRNRRWWTKMWIRGAESEISRNRNQRDWLSWSALRYPIELGLGCWWCSTTGKLPQRMACKSRKSTCGRQRLANKTYCGVKTQGSGVTANHGTYRPTKMRECGWSNAWLRSQRCSRFCKQYQ